MSTLHRLVASVKILARDRRIPKPLRVAAAVGLMPLPGPFDEVILLLVAIPLLVLYRQRLRQAWQQTGGEGAGGPGATASGRVAETVAASRVELAESAEPAG